MVQGSLFFAPVVLLSSRVEPDVMHLLRAYSKNQRADKSALSLVLEKANVTLFCPSTVSKLFCLRMHCCCYYHSGTLPNVWVIPK